MDSERIPCGLLTVTSPPQGQASEYEKKYFLTLDSLWLATGNINHGMINKEYFLRFVLSYIKSMAQGSG